jgi:hypothetical protein
MPPEKTIILPVKVITGASKTVLTGREGEFVKIRLAAPPVDGKANVALIQFLAKQLSIPKSCITIRSGVTSRRKLLEIAGCDEVRIKRLFPSPNDAK